MLNAIQDILVEKRLVSSDWAKETGKAAELVALFREYYDGQHRLKLTVEMQKMMQIDDVRLDRYNANYCQMVIQAMADRLKVEDIDHSQNPLSNPDGTDVDPAKAWLDDLLYQNRFDALQIKIHKAALRDGETFVMLDYSDTEKRVKIAHEPAFDGDVGLIAVYDSSKTTIVAAVKAWWEADIKRVNIYYPSQIDRYQIRTEGDTDLQPMDGEVTARNNTIPGVPVIRFGTEEASKSELTNVVPLQDSLNRTLVSMVMAGELTAFAILFAVGWKPPAGITPGMIMHAMITDPSTGQPVIPDDEEQARALATMLGSFKLERIQGGDLSQLISQADWLISQIGHVSSTPVELGGADASGEAMKQRDVRLVGKLQGAQVNMGNAYEDMIEMAGLFQTLYGSIKPPALGRLNARWKSAEIRNDTDVLKAFELLMKYGHEREALRVLGQASFLSFDESKIEQMMDEKLADAERKVQDAVGNLPGFEQFSTNGANGNGTDNGVSVR